MIVYLPTFSGDVDRLIDLLRWCRQIGGAKEHDAVIVADPATPAGAVMDARDEAAKSFKGIDIISSSAPVKGWIPGANSLFLTAAKHAQELGGHWLWLESDAVPLKPGWLDSIDIHYRARGHSYFGAIVPCSTPELPARSLAGVAVYPSDAWTDMHSAIENHPTVAFDISTAEITVPQSMDSYLFQHLWGEKDRPPRFSLKGIPHTEVFGLDYIRPEAAIYHRVKDGSLIKLLRQRDRIPENEVVPITIVFAFCHKDAALMAKSLAWMSELHGQLPRTCVLHYDGTIETSQLQQIVMSANHVFSRVLTSRYPTPFPPWVGWPAACNWAFREACKFAQINLGGPWLFFEADAVVLAPDWLAQIENEYALGGKPFMGTVFPNNTHMNGVAVYPVNAMEYAPCIGQVMKEAWDFKCGSQMIPHAHQAAHLIQHYDNGREVGPKVFTCQNRNYINPSSVIYHSVKNDSLINLLRLEYA